MSNERTADVYAGQAVSRSTLFDLQVLVSHSELVAEDDEVPLEK